MNENVKKLWSDEWEENATIEESASIIGKWLRRQRIKITRKMLAKLPKSLTVIDTGCGGGTTLTVIREAGFSNSIGIDFVESALKQCERKGFVVNKDVYLVDAADTKYPDRHFDILFEEGLWEHFEDPKPFMDEACRICDKWMLVIQPNHFSFVGGILHWLWKVLGAGGVFEYSFTMEYFVDYLKNNGFVLKEKVMTMFDEQAVMLFRRNTE